MKNKIEEALRECGEEVFYGRARFKDRDFWDCIVYGKRRTQKTEGRKGKKKKWFAAIIKEDEITEELEQKVIKTMREAGFKRTDGDTVYEYVEKSGECVVEICTMEFYKIEKDCSA